MPRCPSDLHEYNGTLTSRSWDGGWYYQLYHPNCSTPSRLVGTFDTRDEALEAGAEDIKDN